MQFTIERSEFLKALQRVINVIPAKSPKEILYNVLLIAEDGSLKIIATDLDITQISWTKAQVVEEGAVAVLGKLLLDILREMPEIQLKFHVEENYRVSIETSMGHYKLMGEPRMEFPSVPIVEKEKSITIRFYPAINAHHFVGMDANGNFMDILIQGKSNQLGLSLEDAGEWLKTEYGLVDAIVIDKGGASWGFFFFFCCCCFFFF